MSWTSTSIPLLRSRFLVRHDLLYPNCDFRGAEKIEEERSIETILDSDDLIRLGTVDFSATKYALRLLKRILSNRGVVSFPAFPEEHIKCTNLKLARASLDKWADKSESVDIISQLISITQDLDISNNNLRKPFLNDILIHADMSSLLRLNLSGNVIDTNCAQVLANFLCSIECNICDLDISGCSLWADRPLPIEVLSYRMTSENTSVSSLTIGDHFAWIDEHLQGFVKKLSSLKNLTVQYLRIQPKEFGILVGQNSNIVDLSTLDQRWENVGDLEEFFRGISSVTNDPQLRTFSTRHATFAPSCYKAFVDFSFLLKNLVTLNLEGENPGSCIVGVIKELPNFTAMRNLSLKNCKLGPAECQPLFEMFFYQWATTVPQEYRKYLIENPSQESTALPRIVSLDLSRNPIGFAAAEYLAAVVKARPWHPLRELHLEYSLIGPRGCQALIDVFSTYDARLRKLDLAGICSPEEIDYTKPILHAVPILRFEVNLHVRYMLIWIVRRNIFDKANDVSVPAFASFPRELFEYFFSFLKYEETRVFDISMV